MKTLLQWEWDLGGRAVTYFFSSKGLFSLEESALPVCCDLPSIVLINRYSSAVKDRVKQKQM